MILSMQEFTSHFDVVELTDDELYYFAKTDAERKIIDEVVKQYPVRITAYLRQLMRNSEAIRKQYLPSPKEMETIGISAPFEEGKRTANVYGLERVYRDRVLIAPNFECPAYCRYCYKKSRVLRGKPGMTYELIDKATAELAQMDKVRGVVVTGGEPLLNLKKLFYLLDKLIELDNIHEIRIGTRTLLNQPQIYSPELVRKFASYNRPNIQNPEKSKYVAFNVHFNHPDELAPEVLNAVNMLTSNGIVLRNQTVLLKGINDDIQTIKNLFSLLLRNNILVYYLNHCMPVEGADHLRTSVQKGIDIYKFLCTESSSIIPNYVYAPSAGKIHVGVDTKLTYKTIDGIRYIETIMPYRAEEFRSITKNPLPPLHEETPDGFIKSLYIDGNDD